MPDLNDVASWPMEKIMVIGLGVSMFFLGKHILGKLSDCESDREQLWQEIANIKDRIIDKLSGEDDG